nr:molybdopterin cofactor-binding domain-containing protein [Kofleriaceae bacterium]
MRITRRRFLGGLGAATAGLALGFDRLGEAAPITTFAPNAFVQIGSDGVVTIVCQRSEMGQGVRSSIPVLIADELGADPAKVHIVQADGDARYGNQDTDGSSSIRTDYDKLRQLGAAAREMLIGAAALKWSVPPRTLVAHDDAVWNGGRKLAFGELAAAASRQPVPKSPRLRPESELVHVGTDLPLVDAPDYVTGRAVYGADIALPGMLTAVIARPPAVLDDVDTVDDTAARTVPGVRTIVRLPAPTAPVAFQPLGGVAVLADHTWAAMRGRAALAVTWKAGPNAGYDSIAYREQLLAAVREPGEVVRHVGDANAALASAASRVEAEYLVPHLAHATMEPPAAVARVADGACEAWGPTQDPQAAQDEIAKALGIDKSKVTVHVTFLGGGFGRKSKPDFFVEAALLAREAKVPVRVQWTRTDELQHGYYHTVSAQALAAGLDASGNVVAWRHRVAYPAIGATFKDGVVRPSFGELSQGLIDLPLAAKHVAIETGEAPAHARIGWMRSVCNVQQCFAVQSFVDELAVATKRDPRDMLLAVIGGDRTLTPEGQGVDKLSNYGAPLDRHPIDVARLHRVIDRVTEAAGWSKRGARALGLAAHRSFLTYVAVVAAVKRGARGEPVVDEAWVAIDAGVVVNSDRVRSQMEGAFVFAMSSAMHGAITMSRGATQQTNFRDYPLARMPEAPRAIHVDLVASGKPPGGVGEPGVPPVAPAIANAVFALTGTRVRELPIARAKLG